MNSIYGSTKLILNLTVLTDIVRNQNSKSHEKSKSEYCFIYLLIGEKRKTGYFNVLFLIYH